MEKEWVQDFIKEKIGVETKVLDCRKSGTVIIAKIESKVKKKEIMYNKNRLRVFTIIRVRVSSTRAKKYAKHNHLLSL